MSLRTRLLKVLGLLALGLIVVNSLVGSLVFAHTNLVVATVFFTIFTGAVLGIVLMICINKMVLQPVAQLREGVEFIRIKGEEGSRINVTGKDELEELGVTINNMLDDLEMSRKELIDSERRYKYLSFNDTLTGLYNRNFFEYELKRINRNLSIFMPVSIISIDIDGHKIVNDTFGHQAGDTQLKNAADILAASIRKGDSLARVGGDEFCIILPKVPNKVALQRKEEILALVEEHNAHNPLLPLSLSVGVATSESGKTEDIYDIYHLADDDMYYHKFNKIGDFNGKVIEVLIEALAERDFVPQGHIDRLVALAERIAARLKLPKQQCKELILLCKIHDIGNMGVPDDILFKSDSLTEMEVKKIRNHVKVGYNIASRSKDLAPIAELILYHHEHWDGNGYPTNTKGDEIPLVCRVFTILDAYDVMTNTRPYRQALSEEKAFTELECCAGRQFEPGLVEEFINMMKE